MATLSSLIRSRYWLFDDSFERPPDTFKITGQHRENELRSEERAFETHPLPLSVEVREFLGAFLQGRWEQEFVHCVVRRANQDEVEVPVRTVGELWFSEYLGYIASSSMEGRFTSRDLINHGFPVGHHADKLVPIGKVLRGMMAVGLLDKIKNGSPNQTSYKVPRIVEAHLKVFELPDTYEFNV